MERFTENDLNIMLEAMDAWVAKDLAGEVLGELMSSAFARPGEDPGPMRRAAAERQEKMRQDKENRQEVATLLKAKLYRMRRDARSDDPLGLSVRKE